MIYSCCCRTLSVNVESQRSSDAGQGWSEISCKTGQFLNILYERILNNVGNDCNFPLWARFQRRFSACNAVTRFIDIDCICLAKFIWNGPRLSCIQSKVHITPLQGYHTWKVPDPAQTRSTVLRWAWLVKSQSGPWGANEALKAALCRATDQSVRRCDSA